MIARPVPTAHTPPSAGHTASYGPVARLGGGVRRSRPAASSSRRARPRWVCCSSNGPVLLDSMRRSFRTSSWRAPDSSSSSSSSSSSCSGSSSSGSGQPAGDAPAVLVVGAGVAGLTAAVRLLDALPRARVTVCAEAFGSDTTSHGAAGVWMPYKLSETPEAQVSRWGDATFQHLLSLVHSPHAAAAGVQMCYARCLFVAREPDPPWAGSVQGFRRLPPHELRLFSDTVDWRAVQQQADAAAGSAGGSDARAAGAAAAGSFVDGYSFNTVVCEGRLYCRWLTQRLQAAGVAFQQRRLASLGEALLLPSDQHRTQHRQQHRQQQQQQQQQQHACQQRPPWDLVLNCSGLGARELLPDAACQPIRGQIMRVRAPWLTQCVFAHFPDETAYIIPNRECVVLGGTGQVGNGSRTVSLDDAAMIAERAIQVVPSLRAAEVVDHWVGLRPGRTRLRVEAQQLTPDGSLRAHGAAPGGMPVVHCYGHGGAGLTLAWGTAGDAVELALAALKAVGRSKA